MTMLNFVCARLAQISASWPTSHPSLGIFGAAASLIAFCAPNGISLPSSS
jgi:hypothetical protein